jgi:hypothetical protein
MSRRRAGIRHRKEPQPYWHKICLNVRSKPDYADFSNSQWDDHLLLRDYDFKRLKINSIITYSLVLEGEDFKNMTKEEEELFSEEFKTTFKNNRYKTIFIWTNSLTWLHDDDLHKGMSHCNQRACNAFAKKLEKL